ncbi:DUF4344 domain-containing metallopeptidase [Neptunomonas japonica]|uniref:DUF4344 domain-containing metallopeptidase n=1 Tax=Neptunomonas japonica TaxID=417574 RepID=UPI0003F9F470|nr:DUF4344 domain-containing metallopeptidase [Neptunomonas japonica]
MRLASKIVLLFCSVLTTSLVHAQNQVSIIYQAPVDKIETSIKQHLKASSEISETLALINDTFRLDAPLQIIFGGEEGPLFDGDSLQILIPYHFVKEVESRFVTAEYDDSGRSIAEATIDAVMHTLFHELAHALIFMHELPIVGKEEDAADSLASVLLIELFNEGQEIAISTADLFNLESTDSETFEEDDFWDEHSLDVQRYYSTLCHVYGSNPEEYAHIAEDADFSEDRTELCIEEYNSLSHSWFTLLAPYTHDDQASQK